MSKFAFRLPVIMYHSIQRFWCLFCLGTILLPQLFKCNLTTNKVVSAFTISSISSSPLIKKRISNHRAIKIILTRESLPHSFPMTYCSMSSQQSNENENIKLNDDHKSQRMDSKLSLRQKAFIVKQQEEDTIHNSIAIIISIIFISSSLIMMSSEYSILFTRCGPRFLPDWLERSSYLSTFIFASLSNFSRIVFQSSLTTLFNIGRCKQYNLQEIQLYLQNHFLSLFSVNSDGDNENSGQEEKLLVRLLFGSAEYLSMIAVYSAFLVLTYQMMNGDAFADGAGMSGIDIRFCRLLYDE